MNGQLNKNVKAISGNSSIRAKFWKTKAFFLKKKFDQSNPFFTEPGFACVSETLKIWIWFESRQGYMVKLKAGFMIMIFKK
jgi:hypothetical protein